MQSVNERIRYQKRKKPKQSAPRWVVITIAILSLVVIGLGIGITTMVVVLERGRTQVAQVEEVEAEGNSAETNPIVIKILTPTPLPTSTAVPAPTIAPPPAPTAVPIIVAREQRPDLAPPPTITTTVLPDGSVTAPYVAVPFVIDGDLEGWADIPSYVSAYTVFQQPWWDQSDDLDAFWRLAWDDTHLYVGVVIVDQLHVQTQYAQTAYRGDSLEMQIDTKRVDDEGSLINRDDFQLILSPGDFDKIPPSAFRFQGNADNRMEGAPGHSITVAAVKIDTGYVLEAAIPWADLDIRVLDNLRIGIALNANDNDLVGVAVQEVMKSHIGGRTFDDPATWGVLILTGGSGE